MSSFPKAVLILFVTLGCQGEEFRKWTSKAGTEVEAALISSSDFTVRLRTKEDRIITLRPEQLSEGDRAFLAKQASPESGKSSPAIKDRYDLAATHPPASKWLRWTHEPDGWYTKHDRAEYEFVLEFRVDKDGRHQLLIPESVAGKTGLAFAFRENKEVTEWADQNNGGLKVYVNGKSDRASVFNGGWGEAAEGPFEANGKGPAGDNKNYIELVVENLSPFPIIGAIWSYETK